jgi:hypothetical protein
MTKSKRKELRVYYLSNSYDDELIEFIKDYAIARGQSYTEVVLEILRAFWLPIALKDTDIDSFRLKDLQGRSIGILRSQLNLIADNVNLIDFSLTDSSIISENQEVKSEEEPFDDSVTFDSLF